MSLVMHKHCISSHLQHFFPIRFFITVYPRGMYSKIGRIQLADDSVCPDYRTHGHVMRTDCDGQSDLNHSSFGPTKKLKLLPGGNK